MIPILMYHEVNRPMEDKITMHKSCLLKVDSFEEQMQYLHQNNFKTITIREFVGHIGNYKYALPILKKYNQKATFFIATSLVNSYNMVSWQNLAEMCKQGMDIQSHTNSHTPLNTLSDKEIEKEFVQSKKLLEKNLDIVVEFLSLPHGNYNLHVESIAKKSGYKNVVTSEPRLYNIKNNTFFIGRINIRSDYSLNYYKSILAENSGIINYLRLKNKIKFFIRSTIGINTYRKIYRFINKIEKRG